MRAVDKCAISSNEAIISCKKIGLGIKLLLTTDLYVDLAEVRSGQHTEISHGSFGHPQFIRPLCAQKPLWQLIWEF